ncbi:MAG: glycosyltransferase [Janthinobacterium lividum]
MSRQFRVAVLAGIGDLGAAAAAARLGSALTAAGLPLADARAVPPGGLRASLQRATATGIDLLVVDPLTLVDPSIVGALRRFADRDPMIAVAQPRFIIPPESYVPDEGEDTDYVLVPDPRCAYVKASALAAAGDDAATHRDIDDLVGPLINLNRVGFRVAVARWLIATHPEGSSGTADDTLPEAWRPALARHLASAPAFAATLMESLSEGVDGRRAVAFDLSHAGPSHSGTTWLARALVSRAAAGWRDIDLHVIASPAAFAFHFGDLGTAVTRIDPADTRIVAALIRIGQPFLWKEIDTAARRAPVLILFMLDTIGLDCQRDAPDELDALWRFCLAEADGLLFNSAFTGRQFARRFTLRPDMPALVSLHSLDLADYRTGAVPEAPADGAILLVGNAMPHKRLKHTASLLAGAALGRPLMALGLAPSEVPGFDARPSGRVTPDEMAALYAAARVVVYPSLYEGFGFPILDALAHRRPILVRDLPSYAEIAAGLPERANIHHYVDDDDLLKQLVEPPVWTDERTAGPVRRWDDATGELRHILDVALAGASRQRVVGRIDALRGRMSYMRARAFSDAVGADDLDRLAGLSGRGVQKTVLWLGRHVPGTRRLLAAIHRGLDRLRGLGR